MKRLLTRLLMMYSHGWTWKQTGAICLLMDALEQERAALMGEVPS